MLKNKKVKFDKFSEFSSKAFPKEKLQIDPFLSKYYRPISLRISWLFFRSGIKPNFVTFAQIIIGLLGCYFISAFKTKIAFFSGICFLHVAYLLDCIDGEIARATQKESLQGLFLDKFAHAITMPCIFISVGIYYSQFFPEKQYWIMLINLFAGFSTFSPVNRLVNTIVYQLINKQEFNQYNLKNYKLSIKDKDGFKFKKKKIIEDIDLNYLNFIKNKRFYKFALHLFRHVTYLAFITLLFIFEFLGLPQQIVLTFWLIVGIALIAKEIFILYIVLSTGKIEANLLNLTKIVESSIKEK